MVYKNSLLTITFALRNLHVLLDYNQNTTGWQPVELSPVELCLLTERLIETDGYVSTVGMMTLLIITNHFLT